MRGTKVEKRPGVWHLRVYDRRSDRQVRRTVRGTERQADTALARFVMEVEDDEFTAGNATLTVGDYLERWLDHIRPTRQPGTVRSYELRARRLTAEIGKVKLAKLTTHQVDRLYNTLLTGGMSASTVRMHHGILSAALHQAVKWELVGKAVTDNATPPRATRFRVEPPEVEVVRTLVAKADETNPILSAGIMIAAVTGCRRGELCGLRWSDIDAKRRVIHVRRSIKWSADHKTLVAGPTKTHQDRRVSLDAVMLAILEAHRSRAEGWAADARVAIEPDGYILATDPTGRTPTDPDVITRAFGRLTRRVGVTCRFHDLRHFTATQLIGAGQDPAVVAGRLGHLDATTTLRIYSHALAERDRAAAEVMGALMAASAIDRTSESSISSSRPAAR
jgi:integrase